MAYLPSQPIALSTIYGHLREERPKSNAYTFDNNNASLGSPENLEVGIMNCSLTSTRTYLSSDALFQSTERRFSH